MKLRFATIQSWSFAGDGVPKQELGNESMGYVKRLWEQKGNKGEGPNREGVYGNAGAAVCLTERLLRLARLLLELAPAAAAEEALLYGYGAKEDDEKSENDSKDLKQEHVRSPLLRCTLVLRTVSLP